MLSDSRSLFRLADLTLDLARGRLLRGIEDIALRPKSFALLSHMVRHAGRVVSKDELLSALWPDVIVTEDSLTQCVHEVRQAPVDGDRVFAVPAAGPAEARSGAVDTAPRLRRDGIAVLPFTLASPADPADGVLLDGLAHDVISRLARLRGFHVIASGSAFALRHLAGNPQEAGRALNVAYAVAGTGALGGVRVRLRIELVDVASGGILWTGDFTEDRAAFTELIGGLTDRIVQSVHMQVTAAETRRALAKPREALDAWENYHAGVPDAFRSEPDRIERALERFRAAARLSPGFARAHAGKSACHYVKAFTGMTDDFATEIRLARWTAEEALEADEDDPLSHWCFGRALWLEGDPEGCLLHVRRSVALSPGFALGHYEIGAIEAMKGDAGRALTHLDLMLALSPFDPVLPSLLLGRATALFRLGRADEAAMAARDAARQPTTFATILAPAALILAEADHLEEARQITAKLVVTPSYPGGAALQDALSRISDDLSASFRRNARLIGL